MSLTTNKVNTNKITAQFHEDISTIVYLNIIVDGNTKYVVIRAQEDISLHSRELKAIRTDLCITENDINGRTIPRNDIIYPSGFDLMFGVIKTTYRGILQVVVMNHSHIPIYFKRGDIIAQLQFEHVYIPQKGWCWFYNLYSLVDGRVF